MAPACDFTRRHFLGGLAASSFTMPAIVPSSVFGRDDKAAPSERITVGFIGCGNMANDYHLHELLRFGDVQALAVCEVDRTRREHAKKRVEKAYEGKTPFHVCAAYSDFRDLVGRKDIDAVCIATPEHWHVIPAIEAMKAGKDVYCEKPLTLTLAEGKRIVEVARKYKRVFQTGSQQRSNVFGPFREAAELIRSGRLGKIQTVTVGVGGPSKWCDLPAEETEPGLDWDLWLSPAPLRPYNSILSPRGVHDFFPRWRNYRKYAGGGHADMGAHHYDIAQWCLGMDDSGPVEILPPLVPEGSSRRDLSLCQRRGHGPRRPQRLHLHRHRRHAAHRPRPPQHRPGRHRQGSLGRERRPPREITGPPSQLARLHPLPQAPLADVDIGARSVAITILGNLAYWNGRHLRWDPAKWEFVDDPEANRWLDRERRDLWQLPAV